MADPVRAALDYEALWQKAAKKAKAQAALLYPPEARAKREREERRLTHAYYMQMAFPHV